MMTTTCVQQVLLALEPYTVTHRAGRVGANDSDCVILNAEPFRTDRQQAPVTRLLN